MAPRDAPPPPLEESFAALARQTLDAAHDHVPQCVLPPDDRKARMCQWPPLPLPPPPPPAVHGKRITVARFLPVDLFRWLSPGL